jgi:predicted lysophospholipase L1 biosynthesis ABC-type transport system permease subunit
MLNSKDFRTGIALRLALANLHRPEAPLRSSLLSLGSALTLLVICTLVVVSLQRTIQATIPEESSALVLYDISPDQVDDVKNAIQTSFPKAKAELVPLVQDRIVSDGLFGDAPQRYVGAAWMDDDQALQVQKSIGDVAPNVVTVRTARILASARELLGQATSGLLVVAVISFLASLLVLFSVIAASRVRQVYEASVLNALGVRLSEIRKSLYLEFLLIEVVTALFAVLLGSAIAIPLLEWRMKLPSTDLVWVGLVTALVVSVGTLVVGAQYLHRRMSVKPALLLRGVG